MLPSIQTLKDDDDYDNASNHKKYVGQHISEINQGLSSKETAVMCR